MTFLFGTGVAADMGLVAHLGAPHLRIVPQPLCTPLATTGADAGSARGWTEHETWASQLVSEHAFWHTVVN